MVSNLPLAFLLGLLGSVHCAVMCGPIMLSLPLSSKNHFNAAWQLMLYQVGRILVYSILGFLAGGIGSSIKIFTNQETLSFVIGVILVLFTLLHFTSLKINLFNGFYTKLITSISKLMGKAYGLPYWGFFAGLLNGLIPCGMVYLALATALNSTSIKEATSFMFLFGLGTTPLMLLISFGGFYLKKYIRFSPNKLIPWFTLFLGALFILRSADLGIPFLSPNLQAQQHGNVVDCR